jgi:hypothetical protein
VRSNGKWLWIVFCPLLLIIAAGCGGISASKTVSPLDFLLPGLMQSDPPPHPDRTVPGIEPVKQVAQI